MNKEDARWSNFIRQVEQFEFVKTENSHIMIYRDEYNWLFDFKWFANRLQTIRKNELSLKGHLEDDFKIEYFECSREKKKEKSKKIYTEIINY